MNHITRTETAQAPDDLRDLLRNVERGEQICDLHGRMLVALYAPPNTDAAVLRARLLPLLTQVRTLAAAVAGIA